MVQIVQLFRRGLEILNRKGAVTLSKKSLSFVKETVESAYYGWLAKRNSPIEYHGIALPLDMDVFDDGVRHAFVTGSYEASEVKLIDEYVDGPYDIVDLGASTGFSTAYALGRLDNAARAVAVEANPEMIDVIDAVQKLNDVDFGVEHSAYCPGQSEVTFHVHGKTVSGSTKKEGELEITVPAVTLADVLMEYGVDEFVCLADIEGGEIDLFRNELDLLEEQCALLIVELHEIDGIAAESRRLLDDSIFELEQSIGDVYVYRNESVLAS